MASVGEGCRLDRRLEDRLLPCETYEHLLASLLGIRDWVERSHLVQPVQHHEVGLALQQQSTQRNRAERCMVVPTSSHLLQKVCPKCLSLEDLLLLPVPAAVLLEDGRVVCVEAREVSRMQPAVHVLSPREGQVRGFLPQSLHLPGEDLHRFFVLGVDLAAIELPQPTAAPLLAPTALPTQRKLLPHQSNNVIYYFSLAPQDLWRLTRQLLGQERSRPMTGKLKRKDQALESAWRCEMNQLLGSGRQPLIFRKHMRMRGSLKSHQDQIAKMNHHHYPTRVSSLQLNLQAASTLFLTLCTRRRG